MEKKLTQNKTHLVKVVLFGPESTGKTTLSRQLATHYKTIWVAEYAREYLQKKWDREHKICAKEDIIPIAIGQIKLENEALLKANKVLFCDTDLLETKVYSQEFYNGFVDAKLERAIEKNYYDLYILTYIDTPWVADDLRDRPTQRLEMFTAFEQALKDHNKPYILVRGDQKTRLQKAVKAIDKLILDKSNK